MYEQTKKGKKKDMNKERKKERKKERYEQRKKDSNRLRLIHKYEQVPVV